MRRAHFIVGFSNWGKTSVIFELFNRRRFFYNAGYHIPGVPSSSGFMVQSQSNDDIGDRLVTEVAKRIRLSRTISPDLVCALCPSMEPWNVFTDILSDKTFDIFDEFHFYLLRYKWEHHAELVISEIKHTYGKTRPSSYFHIIDEGHIPPPQRTDEKVRQIMAVLNTIYP